ncbi:PPOX class F420-dependent oxidoreductase [Streptosporangium sp. KLBMP 9127]|nr:PPOX class F420-dependent oxidoreductase [Streptosporangium sp. KLBMP 9127]
MAETFDERARRLLDGTNVATLATVNLDGSPQTSVIWVMRDGDTVLFSTTVGRLKGRNLARDPRVSLSIFDPANPYESVDIRGTAELTVDEGGKFQRDLRRKYHAGELPPESDDPESDDMVWLMVRVVPRRITGFPS